MTLDLTVRRTLRSSPDDIYGTFADSTRLAKVPGVHVEVLEAGRPDGSGHLRRIRLGPVMLLERVVSLDPTNRKFGYRIEDSKPPFSHERGLIQCLPDAAGTRVIWTTTATVPAGVLTSIAEAVGKAAAAAAFHAALIAIDRHLLKETTTS